MIIWDDVECLKGLCLSCGDLCTARDADKHLGYPGCSTPEPQPGEHPLRPSYRRFRDNALVPWIETLAFKFKPL